MKIKNLLVTLSLVLAIVACKSDDDGGDSFDATAQALIDDEKLVEYLQTHHYIEQQAEDPFGVIDTILEGETFTPLADLVVTQNIEENNINYKLYYLKIGQEGVGQSPTRYDSVFVKYRGFLLDSTKFDENISFVTARGWLHMAGSFDFQRGIASSGVIQGWKYGFPNFNSGELVINPGEPISYNNTGKGILFFPSGLAYGNFGSFGIGPNEPLVFLIELAQIVTTDFDNDGVLNELEDLNIDGEVIDDDTDGDIIPNFADTDDDGDGVLTNDELEHKSYTIDTNQGEEEPILAANEYEVSRKDLNGIITIKTVTIIDSNNDGTPDYLDPDTK